MIRLGVPADANQTENTHRVGSNRFVRAANGFKFGMETEKGLCFRATVWAEARYVYHTVN